jgi:protein disulfide-isomerase A6
VLKYDSISKFFDSILDGTATLTSFGSQVPEDGHKLSSEEEEIERKQEAQRLALLHGGFADMIDFEEAIKKYGPGFHGAHGSSASLDDELKNDQTRDTNKRGEDWHEREEDPMHRAIRIQREKEERRTKDALQDSVPGTGETDQVVLETHMATESTVAKLKVAPQASPFSGMSISGSTVGVAPSDAPSPSEMEVVPTHEETTAPVTVHVKDEL